MKYRSVKTGETWDSLDSAMSSFCDKQECGNCPLDAVLTEDEKEIGCMADYSFSIANKIGTITALMGLEEVRDKPRLCEILGVEVNEHFKISGGEFWIDSTGYLNLNCVSSDVSAKNKMYWLCCAIEDPKMVVRSPYWTEQDIEDAKALKRVWPDVVKVERFVDGKVYVTFNGSPSSKTLLSNRSMFPSLRKGDFATLDEILEAGKGGEG